MSTTLEHSPVPSRHAVRTLIEGLVGRDMDIGDGSPIQPRTTNVVAVYVTDRLTTSALAIVDLEGAARLGGALGMVPRVGVDDSIAERDLTNVLRGNCYEVLNVLSAAFNLPNHPHVRLYEMYGPNAAIPSDVAVLAGQPVSRMDLRFTLAGYGNGNLSIVCR